MNFGSYDNLAAFMTAIKNKFVHKADLPVLSIEAYRALEQAGEIDPNKDYHVYNASITGAVVDDATISSETIWSSQKTSDAIGFITVPVSCAIGDLYADITDVRISDDNINIIQPLFIVPSGKMLGIESLVLDADGESPNTVRVTFQSALTEAVSVYLHVTILGEDESE